MTDIFSDYYCIIFKDKIYSQRTPNSKIIEFDLDGIKKINYENLPNDVKYLIKFNNEVAEYPHEFMDFTVKNDRVIIDEIYPIDIDYLKVPEYIEGLPVTKINICTSNQIKQIHLPNTIKELSNFTFANCSSLECINIPLTIKEIPQNCFQYCENLKQINLEHIELIMDGAFSHCTNLKELTFNNLQKIYEQAFANCENLQKINIISNINLIPTLCFYNCKNLYDLVLPNTIKKIGYGAFAKCKNLKYFKAPEELEQIDQRAFVETGLKSVVLNDKLKHIESNCFSSSNYTQIAISNKTLYKKDSFTCDMKINIIEKNQEER